MEAIKKQAIVEKYIEAFDKRSLDLIREIYAADAIVEDPVGTEPRVGIEQIVAFYQQGFDMNAKLTLSGPCRSAGNAVAFPFQVDAAGMTIDVIDIFEFSADGKIIKMKAYWGPENAH